MLFVIIYWYTRNVAVISDQNTVLMFIYTEKYTGMLKYTFNITMITKIGKFIYEYTHITITEIFVQIYANSQF